MHPVVTKRCLHVPCSLVSPEHAFTITKGQEYGAYPSFLEQRKSIKLLLCTLSLLSRKK